MTYKPLIVGHRGDYYLLENSILGFKECIKNNLNMIEIDVWLTKDNIPVVIHCEYGTGCISETSNGKGRVEQFTLKEIKEFNLDKQEKIPTLEEVFILCKGKIKINIEVKEESKKEELVKQILNLIKKHKMNNSDLKDNHNKSININNICDNTLVKTKDNNLKTSNICNTKLKNIIKNNTEHEAESTEISKNKPNLSSFKLTENNEIKCYNNTECSNSSISNNSSNITFNNIKKNKTNKYDNNKFITYFVNNKQNNSMKAVNYINCSINDSLSNDKYFTEDVDDKNINLYKAISSKNLGYDINKFKFNKDNVIISSYDYEYYNIVRKHNIEIEFKFIIDDSETFNYIINSDNYKYVYYNFSFCLNSNIILNNNNVITNMKNKNQKISTYFYPDNKVKEEVMFKLLDMKVDEFIVDEPIKSINIINKYLSINNV